MFFQITLQNTMPNDLYFGYQAVLYVSAPNKELAMRASISTLGSWVHQSILEMVQGEPSYMLDREGNRIDSVEPTEV